MAKPKPQFFELNNGVRKDIDIDTLNSSKFGSYVSTNYGKDVDTSLTLPVDPNEYSFLKTNPFLVTWNRSNQDYVSYSIDEFIIRYKDQDYRFGEFINSKKIRYGTKRRVLKKQFKKWEEEFENKKDASIDKINSNLDIAQDLYYEKKPFGSFILMFLLLIFMVLCIIVPSSLFVSIDNLFKVEFFTKIANKLLYIYATYKLTFVVAIATAVFALVYLVSHVIYNHHCYKAKRFVLEHREWIKDNNHKISRKYKKNINKVKKYYLKHVNEKCRPFPPFRLKNIEMKANIDSFDRLNVVTVDKTHYYRSAIKSGSKFASMMFVFSILILLIYCLLVIYNAFCR